MLRGPPGYGEAKRNHCPYRVSNSGRTVCKFTQQYRLLLKMVLHKSLKENNVQENKKKKYRKITEGTM
jgi:hypothetical protein